MIKKNSLLVFLLLACTTRTLFSLEKIVVVFVVDQLAHHVFQKIIPYTTGGIKKLYTNGTCYENAYFQYAKTLTGPGHATLSTGVWPKDHGITGNYWINTLGKKIPCDYDTPERAAVFKQEGFYPQGKSSNNLAVDSISDQLMLASLPNAPNKVIALSLKNRAAIFTAGKLGTAIWFDSQAGMFTSSKAYYQELPAWLKNFNKKHALQNITELAWNTRFEITSPAYSMAKNHYNNARFLSLIDKKINHTAVNMDTHKNHHVHDFITYSPQSNKLLLELAKDYLDDALKDNPKKILLWISLTSLDKVGHIYGPDSLEYIDTIYHIDAYINSFMNSLEQTINPEKITYAFTADHGSTPFVEILNESGFNAQRLNVQTIQEEINQILYKKYGINDIILKIYAPSIFLNHIQLQTYPKYKQDILNDIKRLMMRYKGIKNIWTYNELKNLPILCTTDVITYYKNQLFYERMGDLIYQTYPYVYCTGSDLGTGHISCYEYTTHVPLIVYQPLNPQKQTHYKQVAMTQFAPTLAQILGIPKPSACTHNALKY